MLTHTAATREEQLRESQVLRSAHGRHGARSRIWADATGEAKAEDDEKSRGRSRTEAREGKAGLAHCEVAKKATELTGPPEKYQAKAADELCGRSMLRAGEVLRRDHADPGRGEQGSTRERPTARAEPASGRRPEDDGRDVTAGAPRCCWASSRYERWRHGPPRPRTT